MTTTHAAPVAAPAPPTDRPRSLGEHLLLAVEATDPVARAVFAALVGLLVTLSAALGLLAPHVLR